MAENHNKTFHQQRSEAFDKVIALIDERVKTAAPPLLLRFDEMSTESMRQSAEKETWSLFRRGIQHLKNGAPQNQPGSITEALSRMSLRSGSFAAALGVKPPQFEQMYFSVNYTTGYEAALFFCRRLIEAAEGDLPKSRQIIHLKMMAETPAGAFGPGAEKNDLRTLKRQMAFSLNVLAETYGVACHEFKEALSGLTPPARPNSPGQGFSP
jgi:hypothetical protein